MRKHVELIAGLSTVFVLFVMSLVGIYLSNENDKTFEVMQMNSIYVNCVDHQCNNGDPFKDTIKVTERITLLDEKDDFCLYSKETIDPDSIIHVNNHSMKCINYRNMVKYNYSGFHKDSVNTINKFRLGW